jgi:hypothetical protein
MSKSAVTTVTKVTKTGKVRKSTKGIPRVTDKVLAMSEADRAAWLSKVPAEHRAEVEGRLAEALKVGRKAKAVDFSTVFNGRTVEELEAAQGFLTAAMATAAATAEAATEAAIAELKAKLDGLKTAKAKVGQAAPAVA